MSETPRLHLVPAIANGARDEEPGVQARRDEQLMLAAKEGDRAAFSRLVVLYERQVRGLCCMLLRDDAQGREAAQEVFLRLWAGRERYRAEGRFRQYLFTVTRNLCRSKRRRMALARLIGLDGGEALPSFDALAGELPGPSAQRERADDRRQVQLALSRIDEQLRTALVLRYFDDLSYEEIAALSGRTPSAIRSRVFYGLKRLSELLSKDDCR